MKQQLRVVLYAVLLAVAKVEAGPDVLQGGVRAVYDLLDRVLPGSREHFILSITSEACDAGGATMCYKLSTTKDGRLSVAASSASELTYGIGRYLRTECGMTIGWPRGGGSNLFIPKDWPKIEGPIAGRRNTPWSYFMNVCTHSYSFVWYTWQDWEQLIDWMALSGINNVLALTGQEEIAYKVFTHFGLNDTQIRSWFNGPALLTWSRGQNEYGSGLLGPLPRSWMKEQWNLQRKILQRLRALGIVGQLPGFQGNVPLPLKHILKDSNMTSNGLGTAWIDSLDPVFGKIADVWMKHMIADFGTDHWYQLDGYFNGGTAPWLSSPTAHKTGATQAGNCAFSKAVNNTYVEGCSLPAKPGAPCTSFPTLVKAESACSNESSCFGVTLTPRGYELREGSKTQPSDHGKVSWLVTNAGTAGCRKWQPVAVRPDPTWTRRAAAAYAGLNRTDPDAIWSYQGFAFAEWSGRQQGGDLRGFVEGVPPGKFVIIDMTIDGAGEFSQWNSQKSYWGIPFIQTAIHDMGGNDGMKGNISALNLIPFADAGKGNVIGTGFTPEGIDQNPAYYEFVIEQNWRQAPLPNITEHLVEGAYRRYGHGSGPRPTGIGEAWALLVASVYSRPDSYLDESGVKYFPAQSSQFEANRRTPTGTLCSVFMAWEKFIDAGVSDKKLAASPQFRFDLVNLGRELLAQLSSPASLNFSDATQATSLDVGELTATGQFYVQVLEDLDDLVATDVAFLVGPWLRSARAKALTTADDCPADGFDEIGAGCANFYEWNARVQLTTWKPTTKNASEVVSEADGHTINDMESDGEVDYAGKHWSGIIRDYYAARVRLLLDQALSDASKQRSFDWKPVNRKLAELAYNWTTSRQSYPVIPQRDAVQVSKEMLAKYSRYYAPCSRA